MTSDDDARKDVYDLFDAAWNAQEAPPVVIYDNESAAEPPDGAAYAELWMRETRSTQISLGGPGERLFAREGLVVVRVHVPAGTGGTSPASAFAEVVRAALEGKETTNGVDLFATVVRALSVDARYRVDSIETPYRYTTTK